MMEAPKMALPDFRQAARQEDAPTEALIGLALCRVELGAYLDAERTLDQARKSERETPFLLFNAARVYAQAVGKIDLQAKPDKRLIDLRTRYQDRAVAQLRRALEALPAEKRAAFWKTSVESDRAMTPIRRATEYLQLAKEVGGKG